MEKRLEGAHRNSLCFAGLGGGGSLWGAREREECSIQSPSLFKNTSSKVSNKIKSPSASGLASGLSSSCYQQVIHPVPASTSHLGCSSLWIQEQDLGGNKQQSEVPAVVTE